MIKISVITIVRNGMPFVEQTINSVIAQDYQNVEYIVVDGGSSDGTVDVIRRHESEISKWISEKDEGISDAFNKGLALSSGDYILFLNADDALASPDVLQKIADEIAINNYPVLLYGDYDILQRNTGEFLYHGSVTYSPKRLRYGQVLPHPCLFTSREYFERYGNFDKDFKLAMDYEWLLRSGNKERVVHVPMLISNIRTGGISTLDQAKAAEEIILALGKNGYFSGRFAEYKTRGYFFMRAFSRKLLSTLGLYDAFSRIRNALKSAMHNTTDAND